MHSKSLLLIRHAKSSWQHASLSDHERPLNARGLRDAPIMASRLARKNIELDIIFSSTAVRAVSLATTISDALDTPLIQKNELYTFSSIELLHFIHSIPNTYNDVAIIGHNPAITEISNQLVFDIDNVPTSGIISIHCAIHQWQAINKDHCTLSFFDYPKRISRNK